MKEEVQIANDFYARLDAYQGSISFWWTPEISYPMSSVLWIREVRVLRLKSVRQPMDP